MAKCKDGFIIHPPTGKCVPKIGSIHSPYEQKKIGAVALGSVMLGGLLGWLLKDNSENEEDLEAFKKEIIYDHYLDDFIPNIIDLDITELSDSDIAQINDNIFQEIEYRQAQELAPEETIEDLENLKDYLEREAIDQGSNDNIFPIVSHIEKIIDLLKEDV